MDRAIQLILVDGDMRRRAKISHGLAGSGIHVEPFEDVSELLGRLPRTGVVLAHDVGSAITTLIEHMGRTGNWLPMVAFAEQPELPRVVAAVRDGVTDYVAWPFDDGDLAGMLAAAEERGKGLASAKLREAMARSRIEKLSEREREVLGGVASGLSNDLIAKQLGISSRTVEIHRAKMLSKMGASHTSEAIRIAIEASLLN